jgi:hypothetical protein
MRPGTASRDVTSNRPVRLNQPERWIAGAVAIADHHRDDFARLAIDSE